MKTILVLFSLLCLVSVVYSQTCYLNVNLKNGTTVSYAVGDIRKIDFSDISDIEDAKKVAQIIKSFKVLQNYPNPFNPTTTISYEIPKGGEIEIRIFDMNGRLVKTITDQNSTAGLYRVVWDGQNENGVKVASGLYLYSVQFDNSIISKKMILIK